MKNTKPRRRDPMSAPTIPILPEDRAAAVEQWTAIHRDNAYLRRVIHRLERKKHTDQTPFYTVPRHAKLRYRPIILGLAPTIWGRSHIAWDDPHGDQLAARLGMGGLLHLMGCFKLRNLYTCPLQDLPLEYQSGERKAQAMAKMIAGGMFEGRVVIVCGNEIRALAGLSCGRDYIGPVAHQIGGSSLVISMVEPGKSKKWSTQDGKREAMQTAVLALLAARLPSDNPVRDAMQLVSGHDVESWRSIGGGSPEQFADLMQQQPREVWRVLAGLGIATPPDLGIGMWYHLDAQTHEALFTEGRARITFDMGLKESGGEYVYGALLDRAGTRLVECWSNKPHAVRGRLIDEAVARGWELPYVGLDRRLDEQRRQAPLHMDAAARERAYAEARRGT